MLISEFGKGLKVIISAKSCPSHDWMSFASWYSIQINLPDAEIVLFCERGEVVFRWPYKIGLKTVYYTKYPLYPANTTFIEISPSVMAVRPFIIDNIGPVDAKSNQIATFVDYSNGCGKFVFQESINTLASPFCGAKRFASMDMSVNEVKILKLWEDCNKTYEAL